MFSQLWSEGGSSLPTTNKALIQVYAVKYTQQYIGWMTQLAPLEKSRDAF